MQLNDNIGGCYSSNYNRLGKVSEIAVGNNCQLVCKALVCAKPKIFARVLFCSVDHRTIVGRNTFPAIRGLLLLMVAALRLLVGLSRTTSRDRQASGQQTIQWMGIWESATTTRVEIALKSCHKLS